MSFDEIIQRRGTHSVKWDMMEPIYGVPADKGISMWVADMDFRAPDCVQNAVARMHEHGITAITATTKPIARPFAGGWNIATAGR